MSEGILTGHRFVPSQMPQDVQSLPLPKPQPFGAPVFITDVATPLAGETVLSLLMKRMIAEDESNSVSELVRERPHHLTR